MIYEKYWRASTEPRMRQPRVSDMRRQIEAHREHLIGETNPSKRAIIEGEMARLARKIVMHAHKSKLRRTRCGRF